VPGMNLGVKGKRGMKGYCICVKCGFKSNKKPGLPCMEEKCPQCGAVLLREGGDHHLSAVKNKDKP
jgi:hypothetical protein